jgi:RimJ/RimL family protein N-acetyltransferase
MGNIWQGYRVRLRAVEPEDGDTHFDWNQDSETFRRLDRIYVPQSRAAARQWAERQSLERPGNDVFHFEVESLEGELVGSVAAHHCNLRNGTFQMGVAIRTEHQRRGYASEAVLLVLRYYFQELRYQKATVYVVDFNEPSMHMFGSLGFQQEGRLRREEYTAGGFHDVVVYGIIDDEFAAMHHASLPPTGGP